MTQIRPAISESHHKINKLFADFEKAYLKKKRDAPMKFQKFRWELKKHIILEENLIFTFFKPTHKQTNQYVKKLMNEHNVILDTTEQTDNDHINTLLFETGTLNFEGFKNLIEKHESFEEMTFYPLLDTTVDEETKKDIVSRINKKLL